MGQTDDRHPDKDPQPRDDEVAYRVAVRTAAVAGIFALIVFVLLLYDYRQRLADDPLEYGPLVALKAALVEQPENEQLRKEIETLDLQLREHYFRRKAFTATGACLLLGAMAVFLVAAKSATTLRRKLPMPGPYAAPRDVDEEAASVGRWAVAAICLLLVAAAVALGFAISTVLPRSPEELASLVEEGPGEELAADVPRPYRPPAPEDVDKMWSRFRGPGGLGVSAYTNVPQSWDEKSGKNIRWKTPVPLPGFNSPVVWGNRVFLSGATKDAREVYCFDTADGKLLWQRKVPTTPQAVAEPPEPSTDTGYAAPTMATDGQHVFAVFATADLAAFDFDGRMAWNTSLGVPENAYGHASSLMTYRNLLVVQLDQGHSEKQEKSRLLAFDAATGEQVWSVRRKVVNSWSTPIVFTHDGRDQLIVCSDPWVTAYDPTDGTEIWRAKVLSGEHGPTPVYANGLVYAGNEYCQLSAIRPDGEGDVTETHVAWTAEDGLPDTCSPLATDQFLFLLPATCYFTCYDAKTGEMLWDTGELDWDEDFGNAAFTASPSLVGNRIYLFGELDKEDEKDEEGFPAKFCRAWIVEPSREGCKIIGTADLEEGCVASPAFQDGCIYVRGRKHLYCIAEP